MADQQNERGGGDAAGSQGHQKAVSVAPRQSEAETHKCEHNQKPYFGKPENWVSLLTLIAVSIYTVITAALWGNSTEQLKVSRDTQQRQLRAYVSFEAGDIVLTGLTLIPEVNLKNFGQTPAYDLIARMRLQTADRNVPFSGAPLDVEPTSSGVIAPTVRFHPRASLDILSGDVEPLKRGDKIAYVIGRTEYADAFDRCWMLDFRFRGARFVPEHSGWTLEMTETGNQETLLQQKRPCH